MSSIFFLGAGASNAFGYPTTFEFMEVVRKANLGSMYGYIVHNYLAQYKKEASVDIEKVLWAADEFLKSIQGIKSPKTLQEWLFFNTSILGDPQNLREQ